MERYWNEITRSWEPLTNYGFIITMSPEALAQFLSKEFCDGNLEKQILEWLYQVKEN